MRSFFFFFFSDIAVVERKSLHRFGIDFSKDIKCYHETLHSLTVAHFTVGLVFFCHLCTHQTFNARGIRVYPIFVQDLFTIVIKKKNPFRVQYEGKRETRSKKCLLHHISLIPCCVTRISIDIARCELIQ